MSRLNPVCPFCKGAIPADLERYGGSCPHCLLEIPGDDAPTDPGKAAREKQEEEDRLKAEARARKNRMLLFASFLATLVVISGGVYQYLAWQEKIAYEAQEYYQLPLEDLTQPEAVALHSPNDATPPPTQTSRPENPTPSKTLAPRTPTPHQVASNPTPSTGPRLNGPRTSGVPLTLNSGDILSDKDAINAMVAYVTKAYGPQLRTCYEQRAKQIPDLSGIWSVSFTINPDGTTSGVKVTPTSTKDAELEACIQRNAASWKFQQIAAPFKVAKSYRLGPSNW
jgi:hypothetical protein